MSSHLNLLVYGYSKWGAELNPPTLGTVWHQGARQYIKDQAIPQPSNLSLPEWIDQEYDVLPEFNPACEA